MEKKGEGEAMTPRRVLSIFVIPFDGHWWTGTIQVERGNTFLWAVSAVAFPFKWIPRFTWRAGMEHIPRCGGPGWKIVARFRTFQWLWWTVTFKWRSTGVA
jgi:hypothetical protein